MNQHSTLFQVVEQTFQDVVFESLSQVFHEFLYIKSGTGKFRKNNIVTDFSMGDLFWIKSGESYLMEFDHCTELYKIRLSDESRLVIKELANQTKLNGNAIFAKWKSPLNIKMHINDADRLVIEQLFEFMKELNKNSLMNETLLYYQMLCFINIVMRNTTFDGDSKQSVNIPKDIEAILHHIHKNLKDPDMLKLEYMAQKFKMSKNTFLLFFKQKMKLTPGQYMEQTRMKVIEQLLRTTNDSLAEITYKFGFTDESYLNRRFKKYFGITPGEYRKTHQISPEKSL